MLQMISDSDKANKTEMIEEWTMNLFGIEWLATNVIFFFFGLKFIYRRCTLLHVERQRINKTNVSDDIGLGRRL
jgi:hypothetical protein